MSSLQVSRPTRELEAWLIGLEVVGTAEARVERRMAVVVKKVVGVENILMVIRGDKLCFCLILY